MNVKKAFTIGCSSIVILIIAGILFLNWAMFGDHSKHVVGAATHSLAPPQATDIEYYENQNIAGIVSVTYSVPIDDFKEFAQKMGWPLIEKHGDTDVYPPSTLADGKFTPMSVGSCLFYENRHANGGGITVVYIPKESRAYIDKSNR